MKGKMLELKQWLKDSGKEIRKKRELHKEYQRNGCEGANYRAKICRGYSNNLCDLYSLRREYRHKHIAYSEIRGKTRSQIEASYPYTDQSKWVRPDENWIKRIKMEYSSGACRQVDKAADSNPAIEGSIPSVRSIKYKVKIIK